MKQEQVGGLDDWGKIPLVARLMVIGRHEPSQASEGLRVQTLRVEIECAESPDAVAREIVRREDMVLGEKRWRRDALELAYLLMLARERFCSARMLAFASGWDEAVCAFVVERVNRVHDEWVLRWQGADAYPSYRAFADEVCRWCDAYADMLNGLPSLIEAANERRSARLNEAARSSEDAKRIKAEGEAAEARGKAALTEAQRLHDELPKMIAAAVAEDGDKTRKQIEKSEKRIRTCDADGNVPTRKQGGGRKAKFDVNELQCKALWDIGRQYGRGERHNPPREMSRYAHMILSRDFPASDRPFVYPAGANSREKSKVRTKLLKRFTTYCKHRGVKIVDALPLAGISDPVTKILCRRYGITE